MELETQQSELPSQLTPLTDRLDTMDNRDRLEERSTPPPTALDNRSDTDQSNSDKSEEEESSGGRGCQRRRGSGRSSRGQRLVCPVCGQSELEDEHQLTLHIRSHHNNNNTSGALDANEAGDASTGGGGSTQCKVCGKVLGSVSSLDRHLLVHSGERPFSCRVCGTRFTTNGNMHRHMRSHDLSAVGVDQELHQKKRKHHEFNNNNIELDLGGTVAKRRVGGVRRGAVGVACSLCSAHFPNHALMEAHVHADHPLRSRRNYANSSDENETASRRGGRGNSWQDDQSSTSLSCVDCRLVFKSPKLLQKHRTTAHPNRNLGQNLHHELGLIEFSTEKFPMIVEAMMASESRKKSSTTNHRLAISPHNHQSAKKRTVTVAESCLDLSGHGDGKNDFLASLDLKKLNERDEDCDSVSTKASTSSSPVPPSHEAGLTFDMIMTPPDSGSRHQEQHYQSGWTSLNQSQHHQSEEEEQDCFSAEFRRMKLRGEFPCRLCTCVFPNLRALKGHSRVHLTTAVVCPGTQEQNYECNMCHYSSEDKSAVLKHIGTHNGDRPYECAICNYAFTTKANCERHLRNRHSASRCDLKKSIIYHPSEDPTLDGLPPQAIGCQQPPAHQISGDQGGVKRSLFPAPTANEQDDSGNDEPDQHQVKPLTLVKKEELEELDDELVDEDAEVEAEQDTLDAPLDLSMDALDLTKKKRTSTSSEDEIPQDLTTKKVLPQQIRPFFAAPPYFLPPYFLAHPGVLGYPRDLVEMTERLQMLRNLGGGSLLDKPLTPAVVADTKLPDTKPKPQTHSSSTSSSSSVKMVIKNGVLVPKQKQRRYRTERPFGCEHCSAKFTLRSNMERHVKQQHPQFWTRRGSGRGGGASGSSAHRRHHPAQSQTTTQPNKIQPVINDTNTNKDILNNNNNDPEHESRVEDSNKEKAISQGVKLAIVEQLKAKIKQEEDLHQNKTKASLAADDLASVSKLLDNASTQTFRQYFQDSQDQENAHHPAHKNIQPDTAKETALHENKEHQDNQSLMMMMSDDEEGLVASHSEENSGSEENKSENESSTSTSGTCSSTSQKKKSAYSLAPNRVSCPYCLRKFPWSSSLRRHVLTHTGQKPFKCPHCPLLFTTKSNCDRHLARKHGHQHQQQPQQHQEEQPRNVPERPYKCNRCPSSTFSTLGNLKKHISKHDDPSSCGHDDTQEEQQPAAASPPPSVAPPPSSSSSEIPFFKCHLCEGAFAERQEALDHLRDTHEPEYAALVNKGALESSCEEVEEQETDHQQQQHHQQHHHHESTRTGKFPDYANRKVMCAFCLRRFWSAEDLRRHMRTHTGERPFSCDVCTRKFTLKHSMLRHRKKHACSSARPAPLTAPPAAASSPGRRSSTSSAPHSPAPEESDLIGNLLGIGDRSLVESMLEKSADDAAKLLGVVQTK